MGRVISLAHLTVPNMPPPDMVLLASRCGYSHVGLRLAPVFRGGWAFSFADSPALLRQTKAALDATGVEVLDVEVARLAPETRKADLVRLVEVAAHLGAKHVLTQVHELDPDQGAASFADFCDLAAEFGMTADLEFLPWTQNADLSSASRIVATAARPNAGVLIDTLHMDRSGSSPKMIAESPASWFRFIQLADAPAERPTTTDELIATAREARLSPGEGGLDLISILRALPEDVAIALEIPNDALDREIGVEARLKRYLNDTMKLLRGVSGSGRVQGGLDTRGGCSGSGSERQSLGAP